VSVLVASPWLLALLPAALLPWLLPRGRALAYPWLALIPRDRISAAADRGLRAGASLGILLLVLAACEPYRPAEQVERIGEGAQIVLLLDRSRSMDEPFGGLPFDNPLETRGYESKGQVARRLLARFVGSRRHDMYGMVVFSTRPIVALPLTDQPALIAAAIEAGNVGRGLAETEVGAGLLAALGYFEGRPYTGSRLVMLISDGGARLDLDTQTRVRNLLKRHQVALYWLFIRSRNSPGIGSAARDVDESTAPARALHEYFGSLETPYRVYDAENPGALARAIDDVNRLQSLPIVYRETIPRRSLTGYFLAGGLSLIALLVLAQLLELRRWSPRAA
jgi:mxaC protein